MSCDPPGPVETVTARVKLSTDRWQLETAVTVPTGPTSLRSFLPTLQILANSIVDATVKTVEAEGRAISCRKGCGACCRQMVPISGTEARAIGDLVEQMPEPRRSLVRDRFATATDRLQQSEMLDKLVGREAWTGDAEAVQSVGMEYFRLGIACPFLEDESCSIHHDRPISCREYLVTSPAENCAEPSARTIDQVKLPLKVWPAVARCDETSPGAPSVHWLPLILAPQWAKEHPKEPPPRPGPELLRELFGHLTKSAQPVGVDTGRPRNNNVTLNDDGA